MWVWMGRGGRGVSFVSVHMSVYEFMRAYV